MAKKVVGKGSVVKTPKKKSAIRGKKSVSQSVETGKVRSFVSAILKPEPSKKNNSKRDKKMAKDVEYWRKRAEQAEGKLGNDIQRATKVLKDVGTFETKSVPVAQAPQQTQPARTVDPNLASYETYKKEKFGGRKRSLNIKMKMLLGFIVLILILAGCALFVVNFLTEISDLSEVVDRAVDVQRTALDFNVENFHTQLELWEYAYEPNPERRSAFELHNEHLTQLAEEVQKEAAAAAAAAAADSSLIIEQGGRLDIDQDMEQIVSKLNMLREDWGPLLETIRKLEQTPGGSPAEGELKQQVRKLLISNEELFNRLDFNNEIDHIVLEQTEFVENLETNLVNLFAKVRIIIYILLVLLIAVALSIAFYLSNSISRPLNYLKDMTAEIGKGNLDVNIEVKTGDEVEELAGSFNQMRKTLKESREEIFSKIEELETAKKQLEEHRIGLEQKVAERIKELATKNEELLSSSEQLKSNNEEMQATNEELKQTSEQLIKSKNELEETKAGLEVQVKERTKELESAKSSLEVQVKERTQELESSKLDLEKQIQQRTAELQNKLQELEKFSGAATDREIKMIELKKKVKELEAKLIRSTGEPEKA